MSAAVPTYSRVSYRLLAARARVPLARAEQVVVTTRISYIHARKKKKKKHEVGYYGFSLPGLRIVEHFSYIERCTVAHRYARVFIVGHVLSGLQRL